MLRYDRLFALLSSKGKNKTCLLEIMSPKTLARLGKGESVGTRIVEKICVFLDCQPGDIMEYWDDGL